MYIFGDAKWQVGLILVVKCANERDKTDRQCSNDQVSIEGESAKRELASPRPNNNIDQGLITSILDIDGAAQFFEDSIVIYVRGLVW
jgi:hypothetical protein